VTKNFICALVTLTLLVDGSFSIATPKANVDNMVIDLQSQHHLLNPREQMDFLAESCTTLGIEKRDVYGDFTEGPRHI